MLLKVCLPKFMFKKLEVYVHVHVGGVVALICLVSLTEISCRRGLA